MRKIWDIPGGIHPPENKSQSTHGPIENIPLPEEMILPLNQHIGAPALCRVKVGERVLKGQKIAEASGTISASVHASTSGIVSAIEDRPINHPSGLAAPSIVIQCDGKDEWVELTACKNYLQQDKTDLLEKIREAGIAGLGGAGFPTAVKLQANTQQKIDTLIINGTECEPYITADDVLMRYHANEIIHGAKLLAHILGEAKIIFGIEDNKSEAIEAMRTAVAEIDNKIELAVFPTKYPSGGEKQLIQILTGNEVASGTLPAELGIVVQNVGTARAAYRAVRFGEPLLQRVTTVVGQSLQKQNNIYALIGTPVKHVLANQGYSSEQNTRIIIGGPMMGFTLHSSQAPIIKTTNCILAPNSKELPPPPAASACIRCGMCAEACPASLLPQQLYWYSLAENHEALNTHNLFDCIECGACSYVCPSHIPLVQYYRASKGDIKQQQQEKEKSDRSRLRFEFRKERLEKAEAEKEAKRLARKKAAEEAKQKLARNSDADTKPSPALSPAEADSDGLKRSLLSAQQRLANAETKLSEAKDNAEPQARLDMLSAKVKQAEQNLRQAQAKMSANTTETAIKEKVQESPQQKQQRAIDSLKKRLATAQQKLAEAESNKQATTDALRSGVEKLSKKLEDAENEFKNAQSSDVVINDVSLKNVALNKEAEQQSSLSAADIAIEKAKQKAASLASMSEEEKAQANITSLEGRLEKARTRLKKAELENNENTEAFKKGVENLEKKLKQAREAGNKNTL